MTQPFCMMEFISRIPWNCDDPDLIEVLDLLIQKGVDYREGENLVRLFRHAEPAPDGAVWYHVETTEAGVRKNKPFLQADQRNALAFFVYECNRIDPDKQ